MVVFYLPSVVIVEGMMLYYVVLPARKERLQAAEQLKTFDVNNTNSFSASDKEWVLGEIRKWWPDGLDAFNDEMRTKVAKRLAALQRRPEVELVIFSLVFIALTTSLGIFGFMLSFERMRPLGWPSFRLDTARWVAPEGCLDWCNTTDGPGHHIYSEDIECHDGKVVDPPDTTCFGPWSFVNGFLSGVVCLLLFCCVLGTCVCAYKWGGRAISGSGSARINPSPPIAAARPAAAPPPGTTMVSVQCPAGSRAGDKIQVHHEGAAYDATVPAGVSSGQTFQVALPTRGA